LKRNQHQKLGPVDIHCAAMMAATRVIGLD
jgi:hypothetical protein